MTKRPRLLIMLALMLLTHTAQGGIFSKKKEKPDPVTHVPALITILKTDVDSGKRDDAAEELREYDPKAFPEIVPALLLGLQKDSNSTVRATCVATLSKLRPISPSIGYAFEQALDSDGSISVRLTARKALFQYHLLGYRSPRPEEGEKPSGDTKEPPLAPPLGTPSTNPPPMTPTQPMANPAAQPSQRGTASLRAQPVVRRPNGQNPAVVPVQQRPITANGRPETVEPPLAEAPIQAQPQPMIAPPLLIAPPLFQQPVIAPQEEGPLLAPPIR